MMRSLYSAVSGLKTHQTRMDVIGNNIANVNTEAFKSSSVRFSEIMYRQQREQPLEMRHQAPVERTQSR